MSKLKFGGGGATSAPKKTVTPPAKKSAATVTVKAEVLPPEKPAPAVKEKKPSSSLVKSTPPKTTALATRPAPGGLAGFEGELDQSDIRLPRLNVVSANSKLHTEEDFPIGCVVLEKEVALIEKDGTLNVVVLHIRKQYQQKLPYGGDDTPLIFDTEAEVRENGGLTRVSGKDAYKQAVDEGIFYSKIAHVVLAVQAPDDLPESERHRFPLEFDDSLWARCVLTVGGTGYDSFAVPIITRAVGALKNAGLHAGLFTVSPLKKSGNDNTWYVLNAKFAGMIEDASALEFFADLANQAVPTPEIPED